MTRVPPRSVHLASPPLPSAFSPSTLREVSWNSAEWQDADVKWLDWVKCLRSALKPNCRLERGMAAIRHIPAIDDKEWIHACNKASFAASGAGSLFSLCQLDLLLPAAWALQSYTEYFQCCHVLKKRPNNKNWLIFLFKWKSTLDIEQHQLLLLLAQKPQTSSSERKAGNELAASSLSVWHHFPKCLPMEVSPYMGIVTDWRGYPVSTSPVLAVCVRKCVCDGQGERGE